MTEPTENLTGVRIHPPVLALIHLLAAFLLGWLLPLPTPTPNPLPLLGGVLVIVALLLGYWVFWLFKGAQTTLDPHGGSTALVVDGPYRVTRNPIYMGYVCLVAGFPLLINNYWGVILGPVLVFLMNRLVIEYEEVYLARQFGQPYLEYKAGVPRW